MNTQPKRWQRLEDGSVVGGWWQDASKPGRIDCLLCPRQCSLAPGDRGFCFVRENRDQQIVLSTYGRSTGFCIDPIEKKPLSHFYPGSAVLSFGTAGCNLGCQFCQNWDISKSRQVERLSEAAQPGAIARAAQESGCQSVAFTYNDPVVWAEYAIDTAQQCRQLGIKTVAVTAGYISAGARESFFEFMDAANVDLKSFSEHFYRKITYSHLQPVLDTLQFLAKETGVWVELTNLIIPQSNDNPDELRSMCDWILLHMGDSVPIHFTAFHPDFRMMDRPRTDPETLVHAFEIAKGCGIKFPYVGNVHDRNHQSTYCPSCGNLVIERAGYVIGDYQIVLHDQSDKASCQGRCAGCHTVIPGRFEAKPGTWGSKRQPIRISQYSLNKQERGDVTTVPNDSGTTTTSGAVAATPQPLKLDRIDAAQRQLCLNLAASAIASSVTGQPIKIDPATLSDFAQSIVMGAFVTLKRGEILRGCCGVLGKPMPVGPSITQAAQRTAKEDSRMAAISPCELPFLDLDVTLLGPMSKIQSQGVDRVAAVQVGKHGLMIQRGQRSGLLLPSVAVERGWNAEQFLRAVCNKAQLPSDSWQKEDCLVMTFNGETLSAPLISLLPEGLPNEIQPPLTLDQVTAYAQVAGQNIVAFATGGTPSYVIPYLPDCTVNALVLSLQWGPVGAVASSPQEATAAELVQGNAVQVSIRPGIPLQASLFQMCQQAGQMFIQRRFNGELKLGLTLGFDPAMHGYGQTADLTGIDTSVRAVVLSDPRHCGFVYDPNRSAQQCLELLRSQLPVGSRDGAVHSVQVVSTMPSAICISSPAANVVAGQRAPAVAGSFYPAEDAARRSLVESLCSGSQHIKQKALAALVPHAGLKFSGHVAASVWRSLELDSRRPIIVFSPKHTVNGVNWAVCPHERWALSQSVSIASDRRLAEQLSQRVDAFELDANAHAAEHGIEVQLPLLERIAPEAKVVGVALHNGSWEDIQLAASQLADFLRTLDVAPLLVISSDMNHYADDDENRRRDRIALDALSSGDPKRLLDVCRENEISMCGVIPAALVLQTLHQLGQPFQVVEVDYATSGEITGDKSSVVGYAGALIVPR